MMKKNRSVLLFDSVAAVLMEELDDPDECHIYCYNMGCFIPCNYLLSETVSEQIKVSFINTLVENNGSEDGCELRNVKYKVDGVPGTKTINVSISKNGDELIKDLFRSTQYDISDHSESAMLYEI